MNWTAVEAASPASFQPLNAQTIAGARSPSGRRSHCNGCIRLTVHHGRVTPLPHGQRAAPRRRRRGRLCVTRKDRLMSRAGTPYLALELRDRTGSVQARAFRDADALAGRFERGDLVRVAGRVERFRDELQIDVRAIARADAAQVDPATFLPERLPRHRRARRLPRAPVAGGLRRRPESAARGDARRRGAARRLAPRAVHARRSPRLPRRAARAHGRGRARSRRRRACCTSSSTPTC